MKQDQYEFRLHKALQLTSRASELVPEDILHPLEPLDRAEYPFLIVFPYLEVSDASYGLKYSYSVSRRFLFRPTTSSNVLVAGG